MINLIFGNCYLLVMIINSINKKQLVRFNVGKMENVGNEEIRSSRYQFLIFKTQLFKRANTHQTNINLIETRNTLQHRKDPGRVQQSAGRERKQSLQ